MQWLQTKWPQSGNASDTDSPRQIGHCGPSSPASLIESKIESKYLQRVKNERNSGVPVLRRGVPPLESSLLGE